MRTAKSIMLCVIIYTQSAKSQNNYHKYYLEGQLCNGLQQNSFSSGVGGAFGFYLSKNKSVDLRAREIYNFSEKTVIGALSFNYRYHFKTGFLIGVGFGHHHEISEINYMEHPTEAALGSHQNIMHRSGISAEIGYNFKPLAKQGFFSGIYPAANLLATYMVIDKGSNPLITANFGIRIGLQQW